MDIVRTIHVPHRFNDLTKALPPSRYDKPLVGEVAPPAVHVPRAAKYGSDALNPYPTPTPTRA